MTALTREEVDHILDTAKATDLKNEYTKLTGKIMASLFFQRSTRTRLSFESAMHRLGGGVIGFASADSSRAGDPVYAETLDDTIRTIEGYADVVVMRHPLEGAATQAAEVIDIPIINGGDGDSEHPTQTLTDLFTIREEKGTIDGLKIAVVGNLEYMRCLRSLSLGLSKYDVEIFLLAPKRYALPKDLIDHMKKGKAKLTEMEDPMEVIEEVDVFYVDTLWPTQLKNLTNAEREYLVEWDKIYRFGLDKIDKGQPDMIVMHPMPRTDELGYQIAREVNSTPRERYFKEAHNGVLARMALLKLVLGAEL
jgi:aspartate carbamoyltransferase catalytic subunit